METLVAIKWEKENVEQVREGPPRTCNVIFDVIIYLFSLSLWKVKVVFDHILSQFSVLDKGGEPKLLENDLVG